MTSTAVITTIMWPDDYVRSNWAGVRYVIMGGAAGGIRKEPSEADRNQQEPVEPGTF
jgi:hypothetical protein